ERSMALDSITKHLQKLFDGLELINCPSWRDLASMNNSSSVKFCETQRKLHYNRYGNVQRECFPVNTNFEDFPHLGQCGAQKLCHDAEMRALGHEFVQKS